jgi:arylsulfatase A-like enzyme
MSDNGGLNFDAAPEPLQKLALNLQKLPFRPVPIRGLEFIRTNIMEGASDNSPLKRGKTSVMEGGIRVPSFIYAPEILESQKVDYRIAAEDVLPTLSAAAGLNIPAHQAPDGMDKWRNLISKTPTTSKPFITHGRDGEAYIKGNWKLVLPFSGEPELYHIVKDPTEDRNAAATHPDIVKELREEFDAYPRGEVINWPTWKILLDPDFFGGEEDRRPMAGLEGHNRAPTSPVVYFFLLILLGLFFLVWQRRRKSKP